MKTIIIEDEIAAALTLESLIKEVYPEIKILTVLQSVEESVEWLRANPMPDLIFMDIHLSDDSSFAIFSEVDVTCPVIFTTAYDQYALRAFEVNSIDYLLKPIGKDHLRRAVEKFKGLSHSPEDNREVIEKLLAELNSMRPSHKSHFLVTKKDKLVPLPVSDICYIYIEEKIVTVITSDQSRYIIDHTMEEVAAMLNPHVFFRANRQYIVSRSAVKSASMWFGGKLAVNLTVSTPERIFVSKARVREFKDWLTE